MKRALDVAGALCGLIVMSPILGLAALAILIDDGPPIIYRRRVLGVGGCEFDAFKLRTMRVDADAWLERNPELLARYEQSVKLKDDPRITYVGRSLRKFSIDELPQLVNVLRGEMSLVGPRMIHPSELARFGAFGMERLTVRPGVTGLWQISGRSELSYEARIDRDRHYLQERSLWLDLKIIALTVPAVVFGRGAH